MEGLATPSSPLCGRCQARPFAGESGPGGRLRAPTVRPRRLVWRAKQRGYEPGSQGDGQPPSAGLAVLFVASPVALMFARGAGPAVGWHGSVDVSEAASRMRDTATNRFLTLR